MIKLVDLNYYTHNTQDLKSAIEVFATSYEYSRHLSQKIDVTLVKHLRAESAYNDDRGKFKGFKGRNWFCYIPFKSHSYIAGLHPDVVLVQGLIFPLQVILLKLQLGKRTKIIVQHHGDRPFKNLLKRVLQKIADSCVSAYLFTSTGNAQIWIQAKVIDSIDKCHEVLEASTFLKMKDRGYSRSRLGMYNGDVYLWVGRLIKDKDPVTILNGFEEFIRLGNDARLYMIYQGDDILSEVKSHIASSDLLKKAVILVGKVAHEELAYWFSAADFFVSGSHREGSGYSLIECMACGCIPIVTDIPPFKTITDDGRLGLLFQTGLVDSFVKALNMSKTIDKNAVRTAITQQFQSKLSFEAIADDIYNVCAKVLNK